MEELGIAKSNSNYDVLRGNVIQFIDGQKFTSDETGYYRSLIERFSVDLFEAMINSRLGSSDRWNRYEADEATFKTLELFDENKEKNENATSICDLILYQMRSENGSAKKTEHSDGLLMDFATEVFKLNFSEVYNAEKGRRIPFQLGPTSKPFEGCDRCVEDSNSIEARKNMYTLIEGCNDRHGLRYYWENADVLKAASDSRHTLKKF